MAQQAIMTDFELHSIKSSLFEVVGALQMPFKDAAEIVIVHFFGNLRPNRIGHGRGCDYGPPSHIALSLVPPVHALAEEPMANRPESISKKLLTMPEMGIEVHLLDARK